MLCLVLVIDRRSKGFENHKKGRFGGSPELGGQQRDGGTNELQRELEWVQWL